MDRLASTFDRVRLALLTTAAAVALLAAPVAMPQTAVPQPAVRQTPAAPAPATDAERARLAGLRRDATTLLTRAARPDTPAAARRAALRDAAERLRALGADPPGSGTAILDGDLRAALRAAAGTVSTAAASADGARLDGAPIL